MNNIHLTILGSAYFSNILNELDFENILNINEKLNYKEKKITVKILFVENLKVKDVKNYLLVNDPIILFLNHKEYLKKNNINCAVHYRSIAKLNYYKKIISKKNVPNATLIGDSTITLPFYPGLKENELTFMLKVLKKIFLKFNIN